MARPLANGRRPPHRAGSEALDRGTLVGVCLTGRSGRPRSSLWLLSAFATADSSSLPPSRATSRGVKARIARASCTDLPLGGARTRCGPCAGRPHVPCTRPDDPAASLQGCRTATPAGRASARASRPRSRQPGAKARLSPVSPRRPRARRPALPPRRLSWRRVCAPVWLWLQGLARPALLPPALSWHVRPFSALHPRRAPPRPRASPVFRFRGAAGADRLLRLRPGLRLRLRLGLRPGLGLRRLLGLRLCRLAVFAGAGVAPVLVGLLGRVRRHLTLPDPARPRNTLVGANSPSLCPTIDSLTYTGMCFLPSCTAIV